MKIPLAAFVAAILLAAAGGAIAADLPTREDPRVIPVYRSNRVWNGVATNSTGQVFACFPNADGPGVQVQSLRPGGGATPWPNQAWNSWRSGGLIKSAFFHVNALRFGPDGNLWIVDAGATGIGKPAVTGAARLFCFDPATGKLIRTYLFDGVAKPVTYIDDVRFDGAHAYVTDAGAPGIIVVDLKSGSMRRVLDNDPSCVDARKMMADGKVLLDEKGREVRVHADQLEVSPDGRFLYYQPASGPLARIETRWLDDASLGAAELATHVEAGWVDTPTSGGTAIDAQGNIYMGDANARRILRIAPNKNVTTLAADPRFVWTDAMWIDGAGDLWIPAAQLNRSKGMNGGEMAVRYPVWIYKIHLEIGPARNDHS